MYADDRSSTHSAEEMPYAAATSIQNVVNNGQEANQSGARGLTYKDDHRPLILVNPAKRDLIPSRINDQHARNVSQHLFVDGFVHGYAFGCGGRGVDGVGGER